MSPKRCPVNQHWGRVPKVIAACVAALAALGAVAVFVATQIGLPERVAAGEIHDSVQDKRFNQYLHQQELDRAVQQGYSDALNQLMERQVNGPGQGFSRELECLRDWDGSQCWECCESQRVCDQYSEAWAQCESGGW